MEELAGRPLWKYFDNQRGDDDDSVDEDEDEDEDLDGLEDIFDADVEEDADLEEDSNDSQEDSDDSVHDGVGMQEDSDDSVDDGVSTATNHAPKTTESKTYGARIRVYEDEDNERQIELISRMKDVDSIIWDANFRDFLYELEEYLADNFKYQVPQLPIHDRT